MARDMEYAIAIFQSTLLMRGATFSSAASSTFPGVFQSTLLMRGATLSSLVLCVNADISIHAPHARSDERQAVIDPHVDEFQSTLLMRGATKICGEYFDCITLQSTLLMRGATKICGEYFDCITFQSTLLMRGATPAPQYQADRDDISIHAPHARSDTAQKMTPRYRLISIHAPHARSDLDDSAK